MIWGGLQLSKPAAWALVGLALLAMLSVGAGWTVSSYRGALEDARQSGRLERDAHWRAEIEASNRKAAEHFAARLAESVEADRTAQSRIQELNDQLKQLEGVNATIPGGDACGLDDERVRALPR